MPDYREDQILRPDHCYLDVGGRLFSHRRDPDPDSAHLAVLAGAPVRFTRLAAASFAVTLRKAGFRVTIVDAPAPLFMGHAARAYPAAPRPKRGGPNGVH